MLKKLIPFLFVLSLLLAACSTNSTPTAAPTELTPTIEQQPSATPAINQPVEYEGCTIVPTDYFPPVNETDWKTGAANATIQILEYSDFQCPYCAMFAQLLNEFKQKNPDDVEIVFRHFPLQFHDKAVLASQATEAAGLQGKFFEMYDGLFNQQDDWSALTPDDFTTWLVNFADKIGLDVSKFESDLTSQAVVDKVANARLEAERLGIPGTPFTLINGTVYQGPRDFDTLMNILSQAKQKTIQYHSCPPMTINKKASYTATLQTEKGDIVIELYADKAPIAVNSFVFLARQGWYDNTIFHRVIRSLTDTPDFVAQAGDPTGTGYWNPGYMYNNEIDPNLKFDKAGVVGVANAGKDGTNGSQFFITYGPQASLDGGYTIIGQVTKGMDVLNKLTPRVPEAGGTLPPGDKIIKITIEEK